MNHPANSAKPNRGRAIALALGMMLFVLGVLATDTLLLGSQISATLRAPDGLQIFVTTFLGIFIEAAPFLLLGAIASCLVAVFVRAEDLNRLIPKNPFLATIVGALLGLIFPVCECGVVPLARRLYGKGMPAPAVIALLLGAPVLNPVAIASTYAAFGSSSIFWYRLLFTFVIAVGIGSIFLSQPEREIVRGRMLGGGVDLRNALRSGMLMEAPPVKETFASQLQRALSTAIDDFFDTGKFMVAGTLVATAMQTFVPQQTLLSIGTNPVTSVMAMIGLAYVLSVCSTVDSFLALSFVNTFSTGAIVSFLVFGPMIDIKSTLMFFSLFQRKIVLYLVAILALSTLVVGLILL